MKKFLKLAPALLVGIALVAMLVGFVPGDAPLGAPNTWTVFNKAVLVTDTNSLPAAWRTGVRDSDGAEVYYSIVQGSDVNTISLKVQTSLNGSTWFDSNTVVADSAAASATTNGFTATTVYGLKARVVATLANTNPVTVSAWVLAH
jgi:hypothetical protein